MVLKADQLRVKALLTETITLLCKNGLNYRSEFAIEALIGITLDQDDVFLISIKENINGGMGVLDTEAGSPKRDFQIDISTGGGGGEESFVTDDVSNVDSNVSDAEASNCSSSTKKLHRRRRRRRRSNDLQDTRHSEDQNTDFDMDKQLDKGDMENLPDTKYVVNECKNVDGEPVDKQCRVKEEEDRDEDDDLIVVKEEMVDMSGVQQQSYLPADNSYSAPVFSGGTSWSNDFSVTSDTQSAQRATTALSSQTQHAGMSQLSQQVSRSQTSQLNTSQMSQQLNTSQASQQLNTSQTSQQLNTSQMVREAADGGGVRLDQKPLYCAQCDRHFRSENGLKNHMNRHRGRYPYTCPFCGKGFAATNNLKGHMVRHTGVKQFVCHICSQAFSYANILKKHVLDSHGQLF